jgi:nucleoside-diphosphate-sugar epimerase
MTETVLVIGGTGELGAPVARQLRGDGYRVRLPVRELPAASDRDATLAYVKGDLDDTDDWSAPAGSASKECGAWAGSRCQRAATTASAALRCWH